MNKRRRHKAKARRRDVARKQIIASMTTAQFDAMLARMQAPGQAKVMHRVLFEEDLASVAQLERAPAF